VHGYRRRDLYGDDLPAELELKESLRTQQVFNSGKLNAQFNLRFLVVQPL